MTKNELERIDKLFRNLGYYPRQLQHGEVTNEFTLGYAMLTVGNRRFKPALGTVVDWDNMYPMVDISEWYPKINKKIGVI